MVRNDIQPNLQNINSYFKRKDFYIPSYQRPYAWQVPQCEQLIEDIETHKENFDLSTQDNYFFGAILIAQEAEEEYETTLIDGQQRTTTFMLLLKAMLLKISNEVGKIPKNSTDDAMLIYKLTKLKNQIVSMLYNLGDNEFLYEESNYQLELQDTKYFNDSISELYTQDMDTILLCEDYDSLKNIVIKIDRRQKDNKYTNFYKNFRYFFDYCNKLTNIQVRDFTEHFIEYCQVITITSYNTDQAINIFNSLNGTGVPLTPIEVIVSKAITTAKDRKVFEKNWQSVVEKTDNSSLDLNLLITHYIFVKLAEQNGAATRNPGIRAFFSTNKQLLDEDVDFTNELDKILDNINQFNDTELGQILNKFNGNLKPFVSSYMFFRNDSKYLTYLLRIGALLELSDFAYGNGNFKGFLEKINLKYG